MPKRSREELLASLRAILAAALEFNRNEARAAAGRAVFKKSICPVSSGAAAPQSPIQT
jgi:hypothetical protein